jgi:hypothetical protein
MNIKLLTSLILIACAMGCGNQPIPLNEIDSIKVFKFSDKREQLLIAEEKRPELISSFVSSLNDSKRDPVKFIGNFKIEIIYKTHSIQLWVTDNHFRLDGTTYTAESNIEELLKNKYSRTIVAEPSNGK